MLESRFSWSVDQRRFPAITSTVGFLLWKHESEKRIVAGRRLPVQVYVLLSEELRPHYVQAMGRVECVFVCVLALKSGSRVSPLVSLQPPVRSGAELDSHWWLIPYLQDKNRDKEFNSWHHLSSQFQIMCVNAWVCMHIHITSSCAIKCLVTGFCNWMIFSHIWVFFPQWLT